MKNEKNIIELVSTVNPILTSPSAAYLFRAGLRWGGGGGGVDRDGRFI